MNMHSLRMAQHAIFGLDLLCLNLLIIILQLSFASISESYNTVYTTFWIELNASWMIMSWAGNLYNRKYISSFELFSRRTMHIYFYWQIFLLAYLFFTHQHELSRIYVAIVIVGQGIMLLFNRFVYLCVKSYFKNQCNLTHRIIILGFNEQAKKLANYLEAEDMHAKIIGFCEEEDKVNEISNYPILSSINKVIELSKLYKVSDIYSTIAPEQDVGIYKIIDQAEQACIRFRLVPDLSRFINLSVHIRYIKDLPVLAIHKEPLMDVGNRLRKRIFDIIISAVAIVFILSWLIPLLALLIKIESCGPVFFIQQRTGRNNTTFNCFKFRSMKVNELADKQQASHFDNRITKIGNFLRRTSLDEFPQFINVLKGEMSLVGPRPHMLQHTEDYSKLINNFMVRQFLKPGITGWAQVNGYRGETRMLEQMRKRVEHDIWYMENWSLWLDVRIMFMTIYNLLNGDDNAF